MWRFEAISLLGMTYEKPRSLFTRLILRTADTLTAATGFMPLESLRSLSLPDIKSHLMSIHANNNIQTTTLIDSIYDPGP